MANPSNHIAAAAASLALVGAFGAGAFALNQGDGEFDPSKFANAYAQGMNDSREGYQANPSEADSQANRHDDNTDQKNEGDSSRDNSSKQDMLPTDGTSGTTALRVSSSANSENGLVATGSGNGTDAGAANSNATGPVLEPDSNGNGNSNSDSGNSGNGDSGSNGGGNQPSTNPDSSYEKLPQDPTPSKDSNYSTIPVNRDNIVDGVSEGITYRVTIEAARDYGLSAYNIYKGQTLDAWSLFCALNATFSTTDENGDWVIYEWTCNSKEEFENYPYFKIDKDSIPEKAPNEPFTIRVAYRFDSTNDDAWHYQDVEIDPFDSCTFISNGTKDEKGNPVVIGRSYDARINLLAYTQEALRSLDALDDFDEASKLILNWKENDEVIDPFYEVAPGRHVVEVGDTAPVPDGCTVNVDFSWLKWSEDDEEANELCYLQKLTVADPESSVFSTDENGDVVFTVPEGIQWVEPSEWSWPPFYTDTFVIPSNTFREIDGANPNLYVAKRYVVNPDNPRFAATENGILTNKDGNEYLAIPSGLEEVDIPAEVTNITLPSTQVDEITQKIVLQSHDADALPSIAFPDWNTFNFEVSEELFEQFANAYYANFDPEKGNTLSLSTDPNANLYFKNGYMRNDGELYKAVETGAKSISLQGNVTVRSHCYSGAPSLGTLVVSGTELPVFEEGCFEGSSITDIVCATAEQKKAVEEALAASGLTDQIEVNMISTSQEGYTYAETDDGIAILSAPQDIEEFTGVITADDGSTLKATTIGSDLFANCQALKWAILDESVTQIGDSAFYGCQNLQGIFVANGDSISFGSNAYADCDNLRFIASRAMNASFATIDYPGKCVLWRLAGAEGYTDDWGWDYYDWFDGSAVDDFVVDKACDGSYALYASFESKPFLLLGIGSTVPDGEQVSILPSTVQIWASTFRDIESNYTVNWEDLDNLAFIGDDSFHYISDDTNIHSGLSGDVLVTARGANASIGSNSFAQTDITSFDAETNWLCVEKNAFSYSPLLKTVKITAGASDPTDENAVSHLYSNVFDGCDSLQSIEFTSSEPMDLITFNDVPTQKSPFRFNGLLSQDEEAEKIRLIIPEEYRESYLRHWIYQFEGFTTYEQVYSYVARQLYAATDYKAQPTQEQIIEGVKQELLPVENRLRKMMGMPQVTEITVPLPQMNGGVDYGNQETAEPEDPAASTEPGTEEDAKSGTEPGSQDESAKEEKPGANASGSESKDPEGTPDNSGSDSELKPDEPSSPDSPNGKEEDAEAVKPETESAEEGM